MNVIKGIIYGVFIWILVSILTTFLSPYITDNIPYINIINPITIIFATTFFGILYIRNINENEVQEGFVVGIIFIIVDFICDSLFPKLFNISTSIGNPNIHILSMIVLTLTITTILGYLAQMEVDLK